MDQEPILRDERGTSSIPLRPIAGEALSRWLDSRPTTAKRWVTANDFEAKAGTFCAIPAESGEIAEVLVGEGEALWDWAGLPSKLPPGDFHIDAELEPDASARLALGWALGTYRFDRFRTKPSESLATLSWPDGCDRDAIRRAASATFLVRDLINRPASDLGPQALADAAEELAARHDASCRVLVGDALLDNDYPAIHAVGRAASLERAPRLIDISWGEPSARKLTLVGKGVCFDSGGLDLKPAAGMKLMKKDMGGAAHVLGLASMIMDAKLPVRLRVLVPAVENSVSADAYRPLDVVPTRAGKTIEIGNTDAEGRVILADALSEASTDEPDLLIDFATLTGAARIALGGELPALFVNDDAVAAGIVDHGLRADDPLWRMPLWAPYRSMIDGKVADITNSADGPLGGAITAALFLQEFVSPGIPWAHIDMMAWNQKSRPGRPEGGEAMGMRAIYAFIAERFSPSTSSAG